MSSYLRKTEFHRNLAESYVMTDTVCAWYRMNGCQVSNSDDVHKADKEKDIHVLSGPCVTRSYRVECKKDFQTQTTGFVAVEFACRGKASGVNATKSDYWIYEIGDYWYIIHITKLRQLVADAYKTQGGDNRESELALVRYEDFVDPCVKVVHFNSQLRQKIQQFIKGDT